MAGSVKVGGAWKTVSGASVKVGGAWKTVSAGYTKVGGAWKQWFASAGPYWAFVLTASPSTPYLSPATVGSTSSDIYFTGTGYPGGSPSNKMYVLKTNKAGEKIWERHFSDNTNGMQVYAAVMLANGNILAIGYPGYIITFSPDGNVVSAKIYSGSIPPQRALKSDSSNNVYFTGYQGGYAGCVVYKYNSPTDTMTWARRLDISGSNTLGGQGNGSSDVDSSGNVYSGMVYNAVPTSLTVLKHDANGNLAWQRHVTINRSVTPAGDYRPQRIGGLTVDSSGNSYTVADYWMSGYGYGTVLVKYDTNGNVAWARSVSGPAGSISANFGNVQLHPNGQVYVVGNIYSEIVVFCFDSAGNTVWQRKISGTQDREYFGLLIDANGDLIITASVPTYSNAMFKIAANGSTTGNFTLFGTTRTISASTYTPFSQAITSINPGYSHTTPALNVQAMTAYATTITNGTITKSTIG